MTSLHAFERMLMLSGEHTWGWDGGKLRHTSWSNDQLEHSLETDPQFKLAVVGWEEQRAHLAMP